MHSHAQGFEPTVRARVPEPALLPVDGLVFQARLFQDLLCGGLLGGQFSSGPLSTTCETSPRVSE